MPPGGIQAWEVFGTIGLNGLGATTAKLNAFNKVGAATSTNLLGMSGKAQVAGAALLGIGVAAGAATVAGISAFADFDEKMTQSLAIMGSEAQRWRGTMSDTAREVARTTQFSAEQAAESYFFLASAGLTAEQSIAALPKVAQFATAGQFDLATATDLLTDAQSALGLTVDDTAQNMENMARVSDTLVKANTLANASVEQFSTALTTQAGASLKAFNKSVEEGVAVLAALADQGVKNQRAGTSLSRVIRLLSKGWDQNRGAFEKYKVEVFDSQGRFRNLAEVIEDLEDATAGMSDEQKAAALSALGFSARVQAVILPLLGTSEAIKQYQLELEGASGITEKVADRQMQTFNKQLGLLGSNLKDIAMSIGSLVVPGLTGLTMVLVDVINKAREAVKWLGLVGDVEVTDIDPRDASNVEAQFDRIDDSAVAGTDTLKEHLEQAKETGKVTVNEARAIADAWEEPIPILGAMQEKQEIMSDWPPKLSAIYEDASLKVIRAVEDMRTAVRDDPTPELDLPEVPDTVSKLDELTSRASSLLDLAEARKEAGVGVASVWVRILEVQRDINSELRDRRQLSAEEEARLQRTANNIREAAEERLKAAAIPDTMGRLNDPPPLWDGEIVMPDPEEIKAQAEEQGMETAQSFADSFKEQIGSSMVRAGEQIIYGLIQGTLDVESVLKRVMASIISSAIMGPLASAFAFGSPSRVMADRGRDIVTGLAMGMLGAAPMAERAMASVSKRVGAAATVNPAIARMRPRATKENVVRGFGAINRFSLKIDGPNIPAPKDPRQTARDRDWQKFLRESVLVAENSGFRSTR